MHYLFLQCQWYLWCLGMPQPPVNPPVLVQRKLHPQEPAPRPLMARLRQMHINLAAAHLHLMHLLLTASLCLLMVLLRFAAATLQLPQIPQTSQHLSHRPHRQRPAPPRVSHHRLAVQASGLAHPMQLSFSHHLNSRCSFVGSKPQPCTFTAIFPTARPKCKRTGPVLAIC
jgi:hypothetical protein